MKARNGLIHAYILDGDGNGTPLNWQGIQNWRPEKGPLWIHLDRSDEEARSWLAKNSGLGTQACEVLLEEDTRPRFIPSKDGFFLILRGVNCNPGAEPEDMVALRMSVEENRIITMRQRRVMVIHDIHRMLEAGEGPKNIPELLIAAADGIVDRTGDVVTEIDDKMDELEDTVLTAESADLLSELARLRRQNISLRRYIAPQRDTLARMQNIQMEGFGEQTRWMLRELTERTLRFVDDLDSARERAAITQEELRNHLTERMNKAMYTLSIVAAIFLPLSLLTGLLGINVAGIPGTDNPWAFTIVSVAIVFFGVGLVAWFKRIHWL